MTTADKRRLQGASDSFCSASRCLRRTLTTLVPPQLDLIALPLGVLSERFGALAGGVIAGTIGLGCVALAIGGLHALQSNGASPPLLCAEAERPLSALDLWRA